MIVKTGRKLIAETDLMSNLNKFKLYLEKSSGSNDIDYMTKPEMTLSSVNASTLIENSDESTALTPHWNSTDLTLTFTGWLKGNSSGNNPNTGTYGAAYLVYDDTILFSRVTFKETTIDHNTEYELTYIIYF